MPQPGHIWLLDCLAEGESDIGSVLANWLTARGLQNDRVECRRGQDVFHAFDAVIQHQTASPVDNPAVQFICHGSEHGIGLPDGDRIAWEQLRRGLRDIYVVSNRRLMLFMGSCRGFNVAKLIVKHEPCPFSHVSGTAEVLSTANCRDGYISFYRSLIEGATVRDAANRVNIDFPPFEMLAYDTADLWDIVARNYRDNYLTDEARERQVRQAHARHAALIRAHPDAARLIAEKFTREALLERLDRWRNDFFS